MFKTEDLKKVVPGGLDFMPTLRDVARLAGVSTMTVSRVVNESRDVKAETRARVERAIADLGFVPSEAGRLLAQQKRGKGLSLTRCNSGEVVDDLSDQPIVKGKLALRPATGRRDLSQASSRLSGNTVRTVLRIVRATQPISRVDLARRLEVNRSTVSWIVSPLIASGAFREPVPDEAAVH